MTPQNVLKHLQEYCGSQNQTLVIREDGSILIGTEASTVRLTVDAAVRHVGLEAANDNQPRAIQLNEPGYESLAQVLARAFDQASNGKGHERHANALPFHKQPMQVIAGQVGPGFLTGQAIKKIQESQVLPAGRDTNELLGAINYLAGVVIFLESQRHAANDAAV